MKEDIQVETVTPEVAKEYLSANTHNRDLRWRKVLEIAGDMSSGDWSWNGEAIKFATNGSLIDGQHRLYAIVESGVTIQLLVIRGLPGEVQETIDTGTKRKFADVLKLRDEKHCILLATTVRAIAAWEMGYQKSTSGDFSNRQLSRVLDLNPWIREGMTSIKAANAGAGLPGSTAGVLWWAFMKIDPEDAEHFYARLASDEDHSSGDPIHTLRRLLAANRESVRGARNTRYLTALTIKAWNKYRRGEECQMLTFRVGGANPEAFPQPI